MNGLSKSTCLYIAISLCVLFGSATAEEPELLHQEDVIYGRKFGTALTMDVFTPKQASKHLGIILVVSGGFVSSHESILPRYLSPLTNRGFTVFAVVHGSQPRYTVPEIIQDLHRAVRFIRTNAAKFEIDPDHLGITGASAGGHLALMLGTSGQEGNREAKDPIDRASSKVQAVACFFPPTDFLNYGKPGDAKIHAADHAPPYRAAFDYRELDSVSRLWVPITDNQKLAMITRDISPITYVTPDDAPTLIIHGDQDKLVPLQQAESIIEKLKQAGVETKLIIKRGAGHGWFGLEKDEEQFAEWFDKYLRKAS